MRWFGCARAVVDLNDARLPHQRADMKPPSLQPFSPQKPLQHLTFGERVIEMHFIDPPHQGQIAL